MLNKYIVNLGKKLSMYSTFSDDTIVFCLKLWISTIFQSVILYIISALFFDTGLFFSFIVVFCSLRVMIWGYHCKTFRSCFVLTTCLFIFVGIISLYAMKNICIAYIGITIAVIGMIYLMIVSVKDNFSKVKVSVKERYFFVLRILLVLIFGMFFVIISIWNDLKNDLYVWNGIFSYCIVFILTVMGGEKNEEESS